jgi:hypothetical protein
MIIETLYILTIPYIEMNVIFNKLDPYEIEMFLSKNFERFYQLNGRKYRYQLNANELNELITNFIFIHPINEYEIKIIETQFNYSWSL